MIYSRSGRPTKKLAPRFGSGRLDHSSYGSSAENGIHQGVQVAREGYRLSRCPDRAPDSSHQRPHQALAKVRQGPQLAPRFADDGGAA
jgi:hypothetical protein